MSLKVAAVFDQEPWPARAGGAKRFGSLVEGLARAFDTTVVLSPRDDEATDATAPGVEVHRFPRDTSVVRSTVEIARGMPSWPIHAGFYRRPGVRRQVADVFTRARPEVVYAYRIAGAALIDGLVAPERVVFDLDNADHLRFATMARDARGLRRLQYALDIPLIKRWCRAFLPRYGAVALSSDEDLDAARQLAPSANFFLLPNGATATTPRPDPGDGSELLFLGDLRYGPNADGLAWLRAEILPLLPRARRVRVVGRGDIPPGPDVEAVGTVDDLAAEWAAAAALVVPLRAGGGTRLKVLDAMAAGVPVVGTSLGVGGLGAIDGTHVLIADKPGELADAIERVLTDAELRRGLAANAHALVAANFEWSIIQRRFDDVVREVARRAGDRG